jgi:hypothetical protein
VIAVLYLRPDKLLPKYRAEPAQIAQLRQINNIHVLLSMPASVGVRQSLQRLAGMSLRKLSINSMLLAVNNPGARRQVFFSRVTSAGVR